MSRVLEAIALHARVAPESIAISSPMRVYTYATLAAEIERTSLRLLSLQRLFRPGAPVAILMDNGPAWIVLDLTLARLGWVSQPIPGAFTKAQRDQALARAGAGLLLTTHEGVRSFEAGDTRIRASLLRLGPVDLPEGTAKVSHTAGGANEGDGACLSQARMEAAAEAALSAIGPDCRHLTLLPLSTLVENVAGLYATLMAGGRYHPLPQSCVGLGDPARPDLGRLAAVIRGERAMSLILDPPRLEGLVKVMDVAGQRLPDLRRVAVTGRPAPHLLAQARTLGLPVREAPDCGADALGLLHPLVQVGGDLGGSDWPAPAELHA